MHSAGVPCVSTRPASITMTRSAQNSAWSGSCVTMTTALPMRESMLIRDSTSCWLPKSSAAVGSSMTSTSACCVSARGDQDQLLLAARQVRVGLLGQPHDPQKLERLIGDLPVARSGLRQLVDVGRASHEHHVGHREREGRRVRLRDVGEVPCPLMLGHAGKRLSLHQHLPVRTGAKSPIMAFSVVVLPQPFAPMMHTNSPRSTENDTP